MASKPIKPIDYSKPLKNAKYERFSQEYVIDSNATQAAIRAKYSENTAAAKGSQLLTIVNIKNRVRHLLAGVAKDCSVTAEMITSEFKKIAFGKVSKELTHKNKISALENLAKHIGWYEENNKQIANPFTEFLKEVLDGKSRGLPDE